MRSLFELSDEVLLEAYEDAKQENAGQDFLELIEDELKRRHLLN